MDVDTANRLYEIENWPFEFTSRYEEARGAKQRAMIAAERIDHFIATDGE